VRKEREALLQQACDHIDKLNQLVDQRTALLPLTSEWMVRRMNRQAF
tara:strand:+ start:711 stop:851 length:141 start_codon:yes stop_codon:yes gene_type:complete